MIFTPLSTQNISEQLPLNGTIPSEDWGSGGSGVSLGPKVVNICGGFALAATLVSLLAMLSHLKNYTKPTLQRFVIRIKWMIPVFSISTWISLVSLDLAFYVDAIRDVYEAFVIYCFFSLMVNYMGGERGLLTKLYGRPPTKHMWPAYYFSKEMEVGDPYSFLFLKRGILQYVYIKPIIAVATMWLKYTNNYDENDLSLSSGYFYITFVYNISVCVSLYCLVFLFQTIKDDIREYRPLAKFLCVKAIVFFTFWQGLVISALVSTGLVHLGDGLSEEHTAVALQDSVICIELLVAAIAHWYAFTYSDYIPEHGTIVRLKLYYAIRDAIGIKDIILDSVETYSGDQYNYRTFEPVSVGAVTEIGRKNRLKAGLRFSSGGQHKYWLDNQARGSSATSRLLDDAESPGSHEYIPTVDLSFDSVILDSEAESLYDSSRHFTFGDYNIPTIETPSTPTRRYSPSLSGQRRPSSRSSRRTNMQKSTLSPNEPSEGSKRVASPLATQEISEPQTKEIFEPQIKDGTQNNINKSPSVNRSGSLVASPWNSSIQRDQAGWQEELRRAANRQAEDNEESDAALDPWKRQNLYF